MTDRRRAQISSRKQPKQARSTDLVAAVLDAAVQVLAKEGAQRFTTARVAEKAGVSVGSLYQYFPNKAAILFRLQSDEWRQTTELLRGILEDARRPPLERLRTLPSSARNVRKPRCVWRSMMLPLSIAMHPRRRRRECGEPALSKPSCGRRCPRPQKQRVLRPAT
jgi:AcrR family transcriptional regulator